MQSNHFISSLIKLFNLICFSYNNSFLIGILEGRSRSYTNGRHGRVCLELHDCFLEWICNLFWFYSCCDDNCQVSNSIRGFMTRIIIVALQSRVRPRFFDQVGHQTTNASIGNKYFFTKLCLCHTYKNYEQSRQKLATFLENKVL